MEKIKNNCTKKPVGRPTKYNPKYCQEIIEFFNVEPYREVVSERIISQDGKEKEIKKTVANDLPLLSAFAHSIGVNQDSLHEWARVHPDFSEALKKAKEKQEDILVTNGLKNNYAQPFTIFAMKNICGWRDTQHVESDALTEILKNIREKCK